MDPTTISPDAVTTAQTALAEVARTLILALTPILVGAITALALKLLKKAGLDVDAQKQAKVEYYARLAIQEAEEWAAKRLASSNYVATGAEKLQRVTANLLDKVPGITIGEATELVHSLLPEVGAGAVAAAGKVIVAATTQTGDVTVTTNQPASKPTEHP